MNCFISNFLLQGTEHFRLGKNLMDVPQNLKQSRKTQR